MISTCIFHQRIYSLRIRITGILQRGITGAPLTGGSTEQQQQPCLISSRTKWNLGMNIEIQTFRSDFENCIQTPIWNCCRKTKISQ